MEQLTDKQPLGEDVVDVARETIPAPVEEKTKRHSKPSTYLSSYCS